MLVDGPVQPILIEELAVGGLDVGSDGARRDDAGELAVELDRTVLVKVPVETVLVVRNGRDKRDDQAPGPPDLRGIGPHVVMLPAEAGILLVQADGVLDLHGVARAVYHDGVEVADLAEAVAAELERVGQGPDVVLTSIESVLAPLSRARVAVGDDHLREGSPVEDGPHAPSILVADRVEDETFARGEAYSEAPLLPADLVPVYLEAWAVGLGDLQRLEAGAGGPVVRLVGPRLLGDRDDAVVLHPDDFHFV